jgi:hypothetical protein
MIGRALAFVLFVVGFSIAQTPQVPANDLVRQVINHELQAENQDHIRWMYRMESQKADGSKEVDQVIETNEGNLRRPLLIDGREPTAQEQQQADQYNRQLVQDPSALRKAHKQGADDQERTQKMLKALPDAFLFSYAEQQGDLVKLNFVPNPKFNPPSREAEVFHALEGYMWVNCRQARLAEIAGHLTRKVKFGGGLLGHLDSGGSFDVRKSEVAAGCWKLSQLNVHMTGRVLFFRTISEDQKESRSDFKHMPANLTLAQAADLLQKPQAISQLRASRQGKAAAEVSNDRP